MDAAKEARRGAEAGGCTIEPCVPVDCGGVSAVADLGTGTAWNAGADRAVDRVNIEWAAT